MRISFLYSTGRQDAGVVRRSASDLVVMCPWGKAPVETLTAFVDDLEPAEKAAMLAALGTEPGCRIP
jgi:hypothetical protein